MAGGINQVIEYIEKHLEDEIDYEKIADIFGYSVYHVQRLFAMVAGVERHSAAKAPPASGDIFFTHSRHVECVILMQNCGIEGKK